jgi:hypothetical protein
MKAAGVACDKRGKNRVLGRALTKIHSFNSALGISEIPFSPTTCRVSVFNDKELRIFQDWNSAWEVSSQLEDPARIWKYCSGRYALWKEFPRRLILCSLQFSPTPSSVPGRSWDIPEGSVWTISPPLPNHPHQYAKLSRSSNCIALALEYEGTTTIVDLHSQAPSQLIDTDVWIRGSALIGNVLMMDSTIVLAWLRTRGVGGWHFSVWWQKGRSQE